MIVSRLAKNLVRSGRVLQHSYNAAFNFNSDSNYSNFNSKSNFNFNFNSNSDSNPTNLIYIYRVCEKGPIYKVSKVRYPTITDGGDDCFNYSGFLRICSHSHGIVCFSNCRDDIFLFNPFTRLFLPLHPPPLLSSHILHNLPRDDNYEDYYREIGVRFCYYPDSNYFKVVRFVGYEGRGGLLYTLADVYNSNTGNWTQILNTPVRGPFPYGCGNDYVFHNGVHYTTTYTHDQEFIQSFDMNREVFNPLIPISNVTYYSELRQLHIWNGSIVLLSYPSYEDSETNTGTQNLHIWGIDKDESGAVSLSELFTFSCNSSWWPLLFVNSDELLMTDSDENVVSYNLKTQEIKHLQVKADDVSIFEKTSFSFQGETCKHERVIS